MKNLRTDPVECARVIIFRAMFRETPEGEQRGSLMPEVAIVVGIWVIAGLILSYLTSA